MTHAHDLPDGGDDALREERDERIPVPIARGDRVMFMTLDEARALRDWLVAHVPDAPFGGGE